MSEKKSVKCESCGKFRKVEHVFGVGGENDEWWTECFYCCSQSDRETYFKNEKLKDLE